MCLTRPPGKRFEGLNFAFFFGADKNRFTIEKLEADGTFNEQLARHRHRFGKSLRPGEIACSWSHRLIYADIIEKGFKRVLILEDDAVPDPNELIKITQILAEIPDSAELVYWGWGKNGERNWSGWWKQLTYHIQFALGMLKWNHRIIRNLYARTYSTHLRRAGFHDFTYAYAITDAAATKLIDMQTPIQYIADNLLAHAATGEVVEAYTVYPKAFLHDEGPEGQARPSYIR
ncbi:MAG: glycosyltransferase family 25 protein [Alphaproteobacteria bacterium]